MRSDQDGENSGGRVVTPLSTVAAGAGALTIGALAGGLSYYHGTTKKLAEEGIDPVLRLKALPLAGKALGVSLLGSLLLACAGWGAFRVLGGEAKEVAQVSGFLDAVAVAKQQRDAMRKELRARIYGEGEGAGDARGRDS